eukprot:1973429-Rhodomonas_salina.2
MTRLMTLRSEPMTRLMTLSSEPEPRLPSTTDTAMSSNRIATPGTDARGPGRNRGLGDRASAAARAGLEPRRVHEGCRARLARGRAGSWVCGRAVAAVSDDPRGQCDAGARPKQQRTLL